MLEGIGQVGERIEPVFFGRLDDAVNRRAGRRTLGRVGEQPIIPADHERLDAPFAAVVVEFQAAVEQERRELFPLVVAKRQALQPIVYLTLTLRSAVWFRRPRICSRRCVGGRMRLRRSGS